MKQKMAVTTGYEYKNSKYNHWDTALLWLFSKKYKIT